MRTAFAIFLFVLVYAPIAYMIYAEATGRRGRVRSLLAHAARHTPSRQPAPLASPYQH